MLTAAQRRTAWALNQVTLSVTPSRTSGMIPLGVFFDASATTATGTSYPMLDLDWKWTFADDAETWADGQSKDTAYGIVVAHVYKTAAARTWTCECSNGHGTWSTTGVVTASAFSGTTHSWSTSGNFTGVTGGSTTHTGSNWATALAGITGDNIQIELCGGETFDIAVDGSISGSHTGIRIKSYGTGKATIRNTAADKSAVLLDGVSDIAISNVKFNANTNAGIAIDAAAGGNGVTNGTFIACETAGNYTFGIQYGWNASFGVKDKWIVQDCTLAAGNYNIYGGGRFVAALGNTSTYNGTGEHNFRFHYINKGQIAHNVQTGSGTDKHILRLTGGQLTGSLTYSEYVTISDNTFNANAASSAWVNQIGPQDNSNIDAVRLVVYERNFHNLTSTKSSPIAVGTYCTDSAFRNNIFILTEASDSIIFSTSEHYGTIDTPAPNNLRYEHNSVYLSSTGTATMFDFTDNNTYGRAKTGAMTVKNNLMYAPACATATPVNAALAPVTSSGNSSSVQAKLTAGLNTQPPTTAAHFALTSSSYAKAAGSDLTDCWRSYVAATPWGNSARDIGARAYTVLG